VSTTSPGANASSAKVNAARLSGVAKRSGAADLEAGFELVPPRGPMAQREPRLDPALREAEILCSIRLCAAGDAVDPQVRCRAWRCENAAENLPARLESASTA
jgi:hypothetical protein